MSADLEPTQCRGVHRTERGKRGTRQTAEKEMLSLWRNKAVTNPVATVSWKSFRSRARYLVKECRPSQHSRTGQDRKHRRGQPDSWEPAVTRTSGRNRRKHGHTSITLQYGVHEIVLMVNVDTLN